MRVRYPILITLAALLAFVPAAHSTTGFNATLLGVNEVPANPSPGNGSFTGVLDNSQTQLTYQVTFSGLLAGLTASHIHKAPIGTNGSIVFPLNFGPVLGLTSGNFSGVLTLNAANVADLLAGLYYVNIHTSQFPGGEIRGQIGLDPTPASGSSWGRIKSLYR